MSVLSQFFTQGSGGSGFIDLEVFMMGGGGGGGSVLAATPNAGAGAGGAGGGFYGVISAKPQSSCTITIGAGGAGAPTAVGGGYGTSGSRGGTTSFTLPVGTYRVVGGGGGRQFNDTDNSTGGCGGGHHSGAPPTGTFTSGFTLYRTGPASENYHYVSFKNGDYYGYPGGNGTGLVGSGQGGNGGHLAAPGGVSYPAPTTTTNSFINDISGTFTSYGFGGNATSPAPVAGSANTGDGGDSVVPVGSSAAGLSGGSGFIFVRYPTSFTASSFNPAPAMTDLSGSTPGYRTYKINSPGTLTLGA